MAQQRATDRWADLRGSASTLPMISQAGENFPHKKTPGADGQLWADDEGARCGGVFRAAAPPPPPALCYCNAEGLALASLRRAVKRGSRRS
jgi:hypothetical protein